MKLSLSLILLAASASTIWADATLPSTGKLSSGESYTNSSTRTVSKLELQNPENDPNAQATVTNTATSLTIKGTQSNGGSLIIKNTQTGSSTTMLKIGGDSFTSGEVTLDAGTTLINESGIMRIGSQYTTNAHTAKVISNGATIQADNTTYFHCDFEGNAGTHLIANGSSGKFQFGDAFSMDKTPDIKLTQSVLEMNNYASASFGANVTFTDSQIKQEKQSDISFYKEVVFNGTNTITAQDTNCEIYFYNKNSTAASAIVNGNTTIEGGTINMKQGTNIYVESGRLDINITLDYTNPFLADISAAEGAAVNITRTAKGTTNIWGNVQANKLSVLDVNTFDMRDIGTLTLNDELIVTVTNTSKGILDNILGKDGITIGQDVAITLNLSDALVSTYQPGDEITLTLLSNASLSDMEWLNNAVKINWLEDSQIKQVGNAYKITSAYVIPEPATATLSLLALCGLSLRRRRH